MRLKLSGKLGMEVSERRQVGDAEEMFLEKGPGAPWWRNVSMEEGM
jgi:pyruvate dehydrogenase kinase 2/3/4